ncbi:heavy-metal-associated domain-containing protein [Oceanithermus desulfurans]
MEAHEGCRVEPIEKPFQEASLQGAAVAYLQVAGMGCPRCATRVRNGLLANEGVKLADVFLERGVAAVAFDPASVGVEELRELVKAAGDDGRHRYRADLLAVKTAAEALVIESGRRIWR